MFVSRAYQNQSSLVDETFKNIAAEIGLNMETFEACLTSGGKASLIKANYREGRNRGVNSTPTFFLEGEKVEQRRYEALVKQIEELLEEKKNPPASTEE